MRWCSHRPGDNACCGHFGKTSKTKYPFLRKRNQCFAEGAGRRPNLLAITRPKCGALSVKGKLKSGRDARAPSPLKTPPANPLPISP
jgi:hypothetical protein